MAKSLEQLKTDFLTCQICKQDCINPKLLECLHFFCEKCLTNQKRNSRVECITCREVTMLKNDTISSLKSMFFVSSMIDAIKEKLKESENAGNVSGSRKRKFTDTRCDNHGERMNFYCQTCSEPVCRDCIVLDHPKPTHLCVNLSEIAAKAREDVEQGMGQVVAMQAQLTLARTTLKAKEEYVTTSAEVTEAELKEIYDTLIKDIKNMYDNILSEIQSLSKSKKCVISAKKSQIQSSKDALSKLEEFFSNLQIHGNDYDLANSHGDILQKTEEISRVDIPAVPKELSHIEFKPNVVCVERIKSGFSKLMSCGSTHWCDNNGSSTTGSSLRSTLVEKIQEASD